MNERKNIKKCWQKLGSKISNLMIYFEEDCLDEVIDYSKELAEIYYKSMHIKRSFEECYLSIEYPTKGLEIEFFKFFDSPEVVSKNQEFQGVFVIYLKNSLIDDGGKDLERLLKYMEENKERMKFILLVDTIKKDIKNKFKSHFIRRAQMIEMNFMKPTCAELMQYVTENLEKTEYIIDQQAEKRLQEYFTDKLEVQEEVVGYRDIKLCVDYMICDLIMDDDSKVITEGRVENYIRQYWTDTCDKTESKRIGF